MAEQQAGKRQPAGAAVLQESVTAAITSAAFGELAQSGYERMSMEAVARRAGVGKAALYRRWSSKDAMLTDLVARAVQGSALIEADTGTLDGDVHAYLTATASQLRHPLVCAIARDLLAAGARRPELSKAIRAAVAIPRRASASAILTRAVDRGELPADLDRDLALDLLAAPLFFRRLVLRADAGPGYLELLTTVTVAALTAASAGGPAC